jgi:hypothetical protein
LVFKVRIPIYKQKSNKEGFLLWINDQTPKTAKHVMVIHEHTCGIHCNLSKNEHKTTNSWYPSIEKTGNPLKHAKNKLTTRKSPKEIKQVNRFAKIPPAEINTC